MKKLFVIVLSLVVSACGTGEPGDQAYDVTRVIQNKSGYDVHIKSYYNEKNNFKVKEYSIKNGQEYVEEALFISEGIGGGIPTTNEMEWKGTVDSVIVTFDTLRFQKHCTVPEIGCVEYERRIILDEIGSLVSGGYTQNRYDYNFVYIIAQEDFDNAEPI